MRLRGAILPWILAVMLSAPLAGFCGGAARVVSLAPNLTELLYVLGADSNLVGRSSACDFPDAAHAIPVAGDFGRPNLEWLALHKPDLLLLTDLERPALLRQVQALGMEALVLPCESWTDLLHAARLLGSKLGREKEADAWIRSMQARREALESAAGGAARPAVFIEIWPDPLTTAGGPSFLSDLVTMAGGRNMAGKLTEKYPHVALEWVMQENPDVILSARMGAVRADRYDHQPGWGHVKAIQAGRICDQIAPDLLLRCGPRLIDGAEQFAAYLRTTARPPATP